MVVFILLLHANQVVKSAHGIFIIRVFAEKGLILDFVFQSPIRLEIILKTLLVILHMRLADVLFELQRIGALPHLVLSILILAVAKVFP